MRSVTSEFTLAEIRGKESPTVGWQEQSSFYSDLIVWSRFIDLRPVSRDVLWATGDFRRRAKAEGRSLALPDAIHIATAVRSRCSYVISADRRLPVSPAMQQIASHSIDLKSIEMLLDA